MAFKFLGQRQLGKLPSRWVSTILMVAIYKLCGQPPKRAAKALWQLWLRERSSTAKTTCRNRPA